MLADSNTTMHKLVAANWHFTSISCSALLRVLTDCVAEATQRMNTHHFCHTLTFALVLWNMSWV